MSGLNIIGPFATTQISTLSVLTYLFTFPAIAAEPVAAKHYADPNTAQRCSQAGPVMTTQLTLSDQTAYQEALADNSLYQIWEVAEQVSKNTAYPQQKRTQLTLQIACQGGFAPAEVKYAVMDIYDHWQHQLAFKFDLCQYITSGVGAAFCTNRFAGEQQTARIQRQTTAIQHLSSEQKAAVKDAVQMANDFFEHRATYEELHSGSSHAAFRIESVSIQNDRYLSQIIDTIAGHQPDEIPMFDEADYMLQQTYSNLTQRLKLEPIEDFNLEVTAKDVESVQRAWKKYREQTASLLASLNQGISKEAWMGILTAERSRQLAEMIEYMDLAEPD
ncbi:hypothetical protein KDD30_18250 (plasmid) [Photobacterium sp. GJ3]|uniref:hypothetical protein n=1 Tax=Photobacterium sp. GJ3 TaxID=2829502 RepID=UPI001B8D0998|nr:hypothetical protein [Photobacterium sp. GJ3]QUJ70091.1 hypothetical protein KDD30_18250 [Photobacterium sp. GJ3]